LPPQCHDTAPHHTNITGRPESDKATKRERGKERERGREGRGREGEGEPQHRAGWRTWVGSETGMEPGELCPFSAMGCTCCMGGAVTACARTQRVNCQIVDTALVVSGAIRTRPASYDHPRRIPGGSSPCIPAHNLALSQRTPAAPPLHPCCVRVLAVKQVAHLLLLPGPGSLVQLRWCTGGSLSCGTVVHSRHLHAGAPAAGGVSARSKQEGTQRPQHCVAWPATTAWVFLACVAEVWRSRAPSRPPSTVGCCLATSSGWPAARPDAPTPEVCSAQATMRRALSR
jgi:hypothetical protein